jgi:tRNA A37 threonylcarbamoyladenosine modification protein TsaB
MNIFLDTISPKNALILFDDKRQIIQKYFFDVRLNESTLLIEEFDSFLKKNNLNYKDLENIVVVAGPGSFT